MAGQGLRVALKGKTPSARARLKYILRQGDYAKGREGPRDDLAGHGSGNLPPWAKGRPGRFWRAVDQFERANGRRCVELELNLPAELTLEQQHAAIRAFARRVCGPERLPYTYAIHAAPGNVHVHLMIQERGLDGIERTPQGHFRKASNVDPSLGGARKSRAIHGAKWTRETRAAWAETLNAALLAAGYAPRFNPHRKSVQAEEALRAGDLRRYGELCTITEKHEGPKIHGMRQRWQRGDLAWDDIPEGAQATIRHNDNARTYNNALRDWLRSATDEQLAERFGDDLREQLELDNPSGHVAAYAGAQHAQALDEDRSRSVAAAQQAGDLELLSAAQIERAELASIHVQCDAAPAAVGQALEVPQEYRPTRRQAVQQRAAWYVAHEFGHWDAVPRVARAVLRARQPEPPALQATRERAAHLEEFLAAPPPPFVVVAEQLRGAAERAGRTLLAAAQAAQAAAQAAQEWHAANRIASAAARLTGKRPAVDEAAALAVEQFEVARRVEQRAMAAYEAAPEVDRATRYTRLRAALQRELEGLHAALSAPVVEAAQERSPELQRLWALPDADLDTDTRLDDEQRRRDQPEPDDLDLGDGEDWGNTEAVLETAPAPAVAGPGGGGRQSFLAVLARLQEHQGDWIDPDQPVPLERHDPDEIDLGSYEGGDEIDLGDGEDWGEIDLDDDTPVPSSRGPRLR